MKACSVCGVRKEETEFYHYEFTGAGRCKVCRRKAQKEYYRKNREHYKAYGREYQKQFVKPKPRPVEEVRDIIDKATAEGKIATPTGKVKFTPEMKKKALDWWNEKMRGKILGEFLRQDLACRQAAEQRSREMERRYK